MAEGSRDTHHPEELQSDLDLLVQMVKDGREDEAFIRRHLESLKQKLDAFVHRGLKSRGGSAG
jgi:hypothetical protein